MTPLDLRLSLHEMLLNCILFCAFWFVSPSLLLLFCFSVCVFVCVCVCVCILFCLRVSVCFLVACLCVRSSLIENALRVAPAETWLTVYRRRRVRGAGWTSWMFWVAWTFCMLGDDKMKIAENS